MSPSDKDRILNDLLAGKPYSEVYNSTRAKKSFYKAVLECAEKHEDRNKKLSTQNETKKAFLQKVSLQVEEKEKRNDILKSENISAETQLKRIRKEIKKHQPEVDTYQKARKELSELVKKGLDLDFLSRVCEMDVTSKEDFLERIGTLETFSQLKEDIKRGKQQVQNLQDKEEQIKQKIKAYEEKIVDLTKKTTDKRLILNDLKLRTRSHKDATNVVTALFLDAYTTEHLKIIREGLNLVRVPNDPDSSVKNYTLFLKTAKGLQGLIDEKQERTVELKTLKKNISELKGELKSVVSMAKSKLASIPSTIVKTINITRNHAVKDITKLKKAAVADISSIQKKAMHSLSSLDENASNIEKKLDMCIKTAMKNIDERTEVAMNTMDGRIKTVSEKFGEDMEEMKGEFKVWGDLREQLGEHKEKIKLAQVLFGIIIEPDEILKIPHHMVAQLLKALEIYMKETDPSGGSADLLFELRRDFF